MSGWTASRALVFVVFVGSALVVGALRWEPRPVDAAVEVPRPTLPVAARAAADGTTRAEIVVMGSPLHVGVVAEGDVAAAAMRAVAARLTALEAEVSSWRPGSDVSKINDQAGAEPVAVGTHTRALIDHAMAFFEETDGAFDVTIGPVFDLWPFRGKSGPIPSRAAIAEALRRVGSGGVERDAAAGTVRLARPGMRIDLGAIGKGYAARVAMDVLEQHGITDVFISAGGDVFVRGQKPDGPWTVAIEHPRWPGRHIERFAAPGTLALATSADARQHIEVGGRLLGHILDPRTGEPATGCRSVSILAADPTAADAYATAVFVMGPDRGMRWVEARSGIEALIVDASGDIRRSSGWNRVTSAATPPQEPTAESPHRARDDGDRPEVQRTTPEVPEMSARRRVRGRLVPVPAGPFLSGTPPTAVRLAAFRIDAHEVSNSDYGRFLRSTEAAAHETCHPDEPRGKDHTPRYWREGWRPGLVQNSAGGALAPFDETTFTHPDNPVVGVDWWDALAYARWAGKRLPTLQEWEKAARGTDGRQWPWGGTWDPARANTGGEKWGERDGHIYAAPARSFETGRSVYGCLHMAGNVAEWTDEGAVAGGSSSSVPSAVRATSSQQRRPGYRAFDVGFRCVADGARR